MTNRNNQTQTQQAPSQDDINASFFASLQRIEERLGGTTAAAPAAKQVPVIKTEDLVSGRAGHVGEGILERAARINAADMALRQGLYEEPESDLSAWEIAGIACGAALLGAGVAVGVSYALNAADSDEG